MAKINLKIVLVAIAIVVLAIFAFLALRNANLGSGKPEQAVVTFISPRSGLSVLGNTEIRAKLTSKNPKQLKARLSVDGTFDKNLEVAEISNNIAHISGTWENKLPAGDHTLEIEVYNDKTKPETIVGKSTIVVKSVSP